MNTKNLLSKKLRTRNNQAGFSLVEIMIVITLLGLIMTFAVRNYSAREQEGRRKGAKILMQQLRTALDDYYRTCGNYPTDAQGGLQALITKPADGSCKDYDPNGYLAGKNVPKDPWGGDFVYISEDGRKYTLKALGSDRKEGGEGNDKDISTEDADF